MEGILEEAGGVGVELRVGGGTGSVDIFCKFERTDASFGSSGAFGGSTAGAGGSCTVGTGAVDIES